MSKQSILIEELLGDKYEPHMIEYNNIKLDDAKRSGDVTF